MKGRTIWILAPAVACAGYFGTYYLSVTYADFGENVPMYFVSYRLGPFHGDGLTTFFEPARRMDELLFRRKHGWTLIKPAR